MIFILLSGIGVFYLIKYSQRLPVFQPIDFHPDLVDSRLQNIKSGHRVLPFKVVDQNGDTITQEDYKGKIYVANFFFTRCRTICPPMMYHMGLLQDALMHDDKVMLLSFSVTPVIDSVPVLHEYAVSHQINAHKWHITTGNKKHIYNLARKSYFAALDEGDGDLQDFVHTEKFILIDTLGQIRGVYDGTKPSTPDEVLRDIRILENE
jgi:protein SCO1/2